MRIVSWNCNGALRKKLSALGPLHADIFIIQECEDPSRCHDQDYSTWASNHLWVGSNKNSGLGVFARKEIKLSPATLNAGSLELFLPCYIADRIPLLAVWTKQANSPTFRYIGQLWKYLQQHRGFLQSAPAMCVGDLNSNVCWDVWDRWWNHSDVLRELQEVGLTSLYHSSRSELQGKETVPTFYMHRNLEKPYHIDYAFLSQDLLQGATVAIGEPSDWLQHSDHMPFVIELSDVLGRYLTVPHSAG
jgi:exonuclease III